MKSDVLKQ